MAEEKKKDEVKEPKKDAKPKVAKPEEAEPGKPHDVKAPPAEAPAQAQVRKLVIATDGNNVKIEFDQTSVLEKREIGRQLMAL